MSMVDVSHMSDEEIDEAIAKAKAAAGPAYSPTTVDVNAANYIIDAREATHGPYREQAQFAQLMKGVFRRHKNWAALPAEQKESVEMILLKLSRIMSGNSSEPDSWIDISGYAMLIYNLLTTGDHRAP